MMLESVNPGNDLVLTMGNLLQIAGEQISLYTLQFGRSGQGTATATIQDIGDIRSGISLLEGTEVTLTAAPSEDWHISTWYVNGIPHESGAVNSITLVLENDLNVMVAFSSTVAYAPQIQTTYYPTTLEPV